MEGGGKGEKKYNVPFKAPYRDVSSVSYGKIMKFNPNGNKLITRNYMPIENDYNSRPM